ncbi:MAG: efflux RND transporter periplasmic adaptor subunit [Bdellovibrionia bacterium]
MDTPPSDRPEYQEQDPDPMGSEHPEHHAHKRRHRRNFFRLALVSLLILVGAVAVVSVLGSRERSDKAAEAQNLKKMEREGRPVVFAQAKLSMPERDLLLIGESRAFYSVTLYARVSGYMTKLLTDIGDDAKQGQLLAHVESPEAQQAYNSAKADQINKRRIADRYRILLKRKLVSAQEAQQAFAAADIADATLKTQEVVLGYQNVSAPFEGKITQRFVDPGALIQNASGSQSASQPLFTISQIDRLRIFIYIDQKDAPFVKVGDPVEISMASRPNEKFNAKIEMLAGELDPKTRTLLGEVIMDNHEQKIVPGSFVQVGLKIKTEPLISLPSEALVMRGNDAFVPVIESGDKVRYVKIDLAENTGKEILIRTGIKQGDRVAVNVGNSLTDGQKVKPVQKDHMVAGNP